MGVNQSTNSEMDGLDIRNLAKNAKKMMPVHWGRFTFQVERTPHQINMYLRVGFTDERVMYVTQKANGNYRIFNGNGSKNPIGYIKKEHDANYKYALYGKKNKKKYLGEISIDHGVTEIRIPKGKDLQSVHTSTDEFVCPRADQRDVIANRKNVRINAYGKTVWAVYKLKNNGFRLECRSPYSWMQAFAFSVIVLQH